MLTRCPHCETIFRVTPEQLKVRLGKVRCGECQKVFNAVETLVEEIFPTPEASMVEEVEGAVPPAPTFESSDSSDEVDASLIEPESPEPWIGIEPQAAPAPEPAPEVEPPEPEAFAPVAAPIPAPVPLEPFLHETPAVKRTVWPWLLGGITTLLILGLQMAIHFRVELAILAPAARPLLESICSLTGCEVGLPAKAELMLIETSDLIPDADHKGIMTLAATLRNQAPFTQEYPSLELTLTDIANQAVARRIFKPADYLSAKVSVADGLAARGELAINLPLDTVQVTASGYRLYLFYP
jgi:predicted Zn finger-like uncharacterized protein